MVFNKSPKKDVGKFVCELPRFSAFTNFSRFLAYRCTPSYFYHKALHFLQNFKCICAETKHLKYIANSKNSFCWPISINFCMFLYEMPQKSPKLKPPTVLSTVHGQQTLYTKILTLMILILGHSLHER